MTRSPLATIIMMITSLGFTLPVGRFIMLDELTKIELLIAINFTLVNISSPIFWSNPVQHSLIHKIDGAVAKSLYFLVLVYNSLIFFDPFVATCLFMIVISFGFSHYFSSNVWCSLPHVISHAALHVSSILGGCCLFSRPS